MVPVVGMVVAGCRRGGGAAPLGGESAGVPVTVAPVEWSEAARPVEFSGTGVWRREAELGFKVAGVVAEIAVRSGDRVTRGALLASLAVDEIAADVDRARAAAVLARQDEARVVSLERQGAATARDVEAVRSARDQADALLRSAEFNARHAEIRAPSDGVILARRVEPGQTLAAGVPVIRFGDVADGWRIRGGVGTRAAAGLRPGDPARWVDSSGTARTGRVERVEAAVDPATLTVPLEIVPMDGADAGFSGEAVRVVVQPAPVPRHPVVPAAALVAGSGDRATVFLVESGRARALGVGVMDFRADGAHLDAELPADGRVVVLGAEFVAEGDPVRIVDPAVAAEGVVR